MKISFILFISLIANIVSYAQNNKIAIGLELSTNANSNYFLDQKSHSKLIKYSFGVSFGVGLSYHFQNLGLLSLSSIISYSNYKKFKFTIGTFTRREEIFIEFPLMYRNYIFKNLLERNENIYLISGFNFALPVKNKSYSESINYYENLDRKIKLSALIGLGLIKKFGKKYYCRIDLTSQLNLLENNRHDIDLNTTKTDRFALVLGIFKIL